MVNTELVSFLRLELDFEACGFECGEHYRNGAGQFCWKKTGSTTVTFFKRGKSHCVKNYVDTTRRNSSRREKEINTRRQECFEGAVGTDAHGRI